MARRLCGMRWDYLLYGPERHHVRDGRGETEVGTAVKAGNGHTPRPGHVCRLVVVKLFG